MKKGLQIVLAAGLAGIVFADEWEDGAKRVEEAWIRTTQVYYSPKTHLFYDCPPANVEPAKSFTNGFLNPGKGYGRGISDCDIVGGVILSMLVDKYAVTKDESARVWAKNTFLGLKACATAHGLPGFVARGLCEEDGKSICITSSRDQITHFIHGLWRYYHSPLCDDSTRAEIRTLFSAVADRMTREVTPENKYAFRRADGSVEPRGVHKMWEVYPHESARLPMIYAAAWDVTKAEKYFTLYRKYIGPAAVCSASLGSLSAAKVRSIMPSYTLLQMQSSLELLYALETDAKIKADIVTAMHAAAKMAADRAPGYNGKDGYICVCAEVGLAQLMAVGFPFTERQKGFLLASLQKTNPKKPGPFRAAHVGAMYWRYRRLNP